MAKNLPARLRNREESAIDFAEQRSRAALAVMEQAGYDPIESMVELAMDDSNVPLQDRIGLHKTLAEYSAPKMSRRAPEKQSAGAGGITINIVKFDMATEAAQAVTVEAELEPED